MNASDHAETRQGRLFRYAAIATIVGTSILLFQWLDPRSPNSPFSSAEKPAEPIAVPESTTAPAPETDPGGTVGQPVPSSTKAGASLLPPVHPHPTDKATPIVDPDPTLFSLKNGEQKVFSDGDLSVSGDFNQVGEMVVPTLHIQVQGKEPEDHALLTPGGRFEVAIGSKTFVVSVLRVNEFAQTLELQVDLGK